MAGHQKNIAKIGSLMAISSWKENEVKKGQKFWKNDIHESNRTPANWYETIVHNFEPLGAVQL